VVVVVVLVMATAASGAALGQTVLQSWERMVVVVVGFVLLSSLPCATASPLKSFRPLLLLPLLHPSGQPFFSLLAPSLERVKRG
jgi:hypothetical protein